MRKFESRVNSDPQIDGFDAVPAEQVAAWEMIEAGRYQPRRIRGSFPGRDLG